MQVKGLAAKSATISLESFVFQRRERQAGDMLINIHYCGVCHSDLHMARNEWGVSEFPLVPGHEIAGRALSAVAPLLCAGVTTWSPLKHRNIQPGKCKGAYTLRKDAKNAIRDRSTRAVHGP